MLATELLDLGATTRGGEVILSGVARKLRVECRGAIYHVMNRGDRQERWSSRPEYLKGGDLVKVKLAARLREETLVTVKWIAGRLRMGTASHVNNRLYRWRKGMLG